MPSRAAPWWMFALAASYLGYFCLLVYCDIRRPEPLFLLSSFEPTGAVLLRVPADSAAGQAGLRAGDELVEVEGHAIRSRSDWALAEANMRLDVPLRVVVRRAGEAMALDVPIRRESLRFWRTPAGLVLLVARLTQALTLGVGLLVAFRRPRDPMARLGAWMLASGGVFVIAFPFRFAAAWRALGAPGVLLWMPFASSFAMLAILFTFFAVFPRPLFTRWWAWAAAWAPMAAVLAWFVPAYATVVYRPQVAANAPGTRVVMITAAAYGAASLIVLALNYRRLDDVNERRRLRVLAPGSIVGLLSGISLIVVYWGRSPADATGALFASPTMAIGTLMLLALPLSFAYAILRRRLFDVSMLVRQGVRYALARRGVLLIVPVLVAVLVADLAYQRERSLVDIVATRRSLYVVLIGLALYAHRHRERWLAALDRRFFRERYNAQRLIREVTADLRSADSVDAVAPAVVAHIETALRPRFAALMLRSPGEPNFHTLASAPAGAAPAPLSGASRIVSLARVIGGPLRLGNADEAGLGRHLPPEERDVGRGASAELVVPVSVGPEKAEVLLVLGSKRSEEPYGAEDVDLLSGLAHALALVVERPRATPSPGPLLAECLDCGRCYDAGADVCADGHTPAATTTERVLARRYRLDRRLGRGGMGAVYEALDLALERPVAVKLTLEGWMHAIGGSDRFRREALIAASFAHPHVVTVYDFGLTGDDRAFLVMELLRGTDLRHELRRSQRFTPPHALAVMRGVCSAVDAAHRRGLIHRDLKPENLFLAKVEAQQIVKVLDFGLARPMSRPGDERVTRGMVLGTPSYMSPEQLRDGPPRSSWDIWSLGVVAYELVTGSLPFASEDAPDESPRGAGSGPAWPQSPGVRLGGTLEPFQRFFARALALDARARPADAREFLTAFEDAVRGSEALGVASS